MIPRLLLLICLAVTTARAGFPPAEASIADLQSQMASGQLTSAALTEAYQRRIAEIDQAGPRLNAVIELNPDALAIARQMDAERLAGRVRGPLHGIPVLLKDNIATADKMETTAGSLALVGAKPPRDAALVGQLRAAGAVILGKTNLSEWANFRGKKSISGWSARGGQTHNPYALDRNTSGSSSGSAAAVAANLCVVAVGSETDGSIVSPASVCGIVGIKPTVGLVSRTGIIPISASQDTAGPMARTVRDAALLLEAMAAADAQDAVTRSRPAGLETNFAARLRPGALKGARLGIVRGPFGMDARLTPLLEAAVAKLKAAGAEIVDLGEFKDFSRADDPEMEVLLYEYKDGLNAYLATLGPASPIKSLADAIAFNRANAARELPHFGQELMEQAQAKGPLTDKVYLDARATCLRATRAEGIDLLLAKHRLDALVSLTNGPAWLIDPAIGDAYTGGSSSPAAVAGYPSVTVPAGDWRGLPVGISFYGAAWTEAKLIAFAADFEAATKARREPEFLPTAKVK
ncbi:MAG TPA: amidase [Lacunisphaera sp.]|nr:amidase [Lacunisphaera sp.]